LLAAALVFLAATACRAAEIGAAQVPADAVPATPAVAAAPAVPAAPPVAAAPGCGCGCQYCGECGHDGACWQRLLDWLTYCPPRTPCCCGCCGKGCTPCCTPLYMYFLDRCSCTLGYHGPAHCPVCLGPDGRPRSPWGVVYSPPSSAAGEPIPTSTNSDAGQR
jgi:hypothetical protein